MESNTKLSEIKNLLDQEKFEEAKVLMEAYFIEPLPEEERGQAYLNIVEMYVDMATHFGQQKKELLQTALTTLEEIDKKGRNLEDIINLDKIRKQIKGE